MCIIHITLQQHRKPHLTCSLLRSLLDAAVAANELMSHHSRVVLNAVVWLPKTPPGIYQNMMIYDFWHLQTLEVVRLTACETVATLANTAQKRNTQLHRCQVSPMPAGG